ncbi:hypothetical protein RRG08_012643 [Elysia crispata]|uniref:Uncharacterized protein n=1 Tax=Elysia crispata TaxID=231223 RepID=A0AAE0YNI5_9GAST|nr:hypothetical protein RRG08_012643 [Elysia crispata]
MSQVTPADGVQGSLPGDRACATREGCLVCSCLSHPWPELINQGGHNMGRGDDMGSAQASKIMVCQRAQQNGQVSASSSKDLSTWNAVRYGRGGRSDLRFESSEKGKRKRKSSVEKGEAIGYMRSSINLPLFTLPPVTFLQSRLYDQNIITPASPLGRGKYGQNLERLEKPYILNALMPSAIALEPQSFMSTLLPITLTSAFVEYP